RVGTDAGVAALAVARKAAAQGFEEPLLERGASFGQPVRVAPRGQVPDGERGFAARHLRKGLLRVRPQLGQDDLAPASHRGAKLCHRVVEADRKSTRLNSSHRTISYAVFCLKK